MTRYEARRLELLAIEQRSRDDRAGVTLGRAAQMLRMRRQVVLRYVHAGELRGEWLEGSEVRGGKRVQQLVLRKGEVRRFRQALEDRRRRVAPIAAAGQLQLQLMRPTAGMRRPKPDPWRIVAPFRMAKAALEAKGAGVDRHPKGGEKSRRLRRVS